MKYIMLLIYLFSLSIAYANNTKLPSPNAKTSAGIEYPSHQTFINNKERYRVDMDCSAEGSNTINCSFVKILVNHADTKSTQDFLNSLKNEDDQSIQNQIQAIKNRINSVKDIDCDKSIESIHRGETAEELSWDKQSCRKLLSLNTRSDLIEFMQAQLNREKETCILSHFQFSEDFTFDLRTKKWINKNFDPMCNTTIISSFGKDPRSGFSNFSWNYNTKNIVKDKSESFLGESCASFDDSATGGETSYGLGSLEYGTSTLLNCKYIDFTQLL